jgi:hydroxymethylpyrimidine/phosphomethylpyrimidine kinase
MLLKLSSILNWHPSAAVRVRNPPGYDPPVDNHLIKTADSLNPQRQTVALTIAGYDPSSGAGVTADLQVFAAHGIFGLSTITAQTVQSTLGVSEISPADPGWIDRTIRCLALDLPPDGIKIGMLATGKIVETVVHYLREVREGNWCKPNIPIVLDTVMVSSSGARLLAAEGLDHMTQRLLPLVDWITPNWPELSALTGCAVHSVTAAQAAADRLAAQQPHLQIVVTGGDQERAVDILRLRSGETLIFDSPRIESSSTHGTGCAFSSALLAQLLHGKDAADSVAAAKEYVAGAIRNAPVLGTGKGPLNFFWQYSRE